MDFKRTLSSFKKEVDLEIEKYFEENICEIQKKDEFLAAALTYAKKITLKDGKRLRPVLVYFGAISAGEKMRKKIMQVSASIELVHMFLLIHDDVIDCGDLRHGIATLNKEYARIGKKTFGLKNFQQFGNSMAIIVGDMVYALAIKKLCQSGFETKKISEIIFQLQEVVNNTIIGQSQDIVIESKKKVSEKEVLKMYENKTAKYTFEGPLKIGLILAGCQDKKIFAGFSRYAISMGKAFQIQDDILGIFGDEKKIGKSTKSDISEGKKTLLVVRALEKGTKLQKEMLKQILGKKNLTQQEIKKFQMVIKETGALDYAKNMANKYLKIAKKEMENLKINFEAKEFLLGMATYLETRDI